MTVGTMARQMTERELHFWSVYRGKKMLPSRRIEYAIAQLTMWVARAGGFTDNGNPIEFRLNDFLFDPTPESEEPEDEVQAAIEAFGFSPQNKKG